MNLVRRTLTAALVFAAACGGGGSEVNISAVPQARAGCSDTPAAAQLDTGPAGTMLPGWECIQCHKAGGQAREFPWQVAGTIFGSKNTSTCNTGGVSGVKVEILDSAGAVQATTTTNAAGNFFIASGIKFPMRARISQNGKTSEMFGTQSSGACTSCHQYPGPIGGAPGRLSLN